MRVVVFDGLTASHIRSTACLTERFREYRRSDIVLSAGQGPGQAREPLCGPDLEPDMRHSSTLVCGRDRSVGIINDIGYRFNHTV